jgi:hypothetical protein
VLDTVADAEVARLCYLGCILCCMRISGYIIETIYGWMHNNTVYALGDVFVFSVNMKGIRLLVSSSSR